MQGRGSIGAALGVRAHGDDRRCVGPTRSPARSIVRDSASAPAASTGRISSRMGVGRGHDSGIRDCEAGDYVLVLGRLVPHDFVLESPGVCRLTTVLPRWLFALLLGLRFADRDAAAATAYQRIVMVASSSWVRRDCRPVADRGVWPVGRGRVVDLFGRGRLVAGIRFGRWCCGARRWPTGRVRRGQRGRAVAGHSCVRSPLSLVRGHW